MRNYPSGYTGVPPFIGHGHLISLDTNTGCFSFIISSPQKMQTSRYELVERLGSGTSGDVMLAIDRVTGREVALKMMDKMRDCRIKNEIKASQMLSGHEGIPKFHGAFETEDNWVSSHKFIILFPFYNTIKLISVDFSFRPRSRSGPFHFHRRPRFRAFTRRCRIFYHTTDRCRPPYMSSERHQP